MNWTEIERLLEGLDAEIEDLPSSTTKNNLIDISSGLYGILENIDFEEPVQKEKENDVMKKILANRLTDEEKRYVKMKYGIDLFDGVTGYEWVI